MENKIFLSDCNQRDYLVNLIVKDFGSKLIVLTTRESDVKGDSVEAGIWDRDWLEVYSLFDYDRVEWPQFDRYLWDSTEQG